MVPLDVVSTPRSLDISITGRCNLRCKYCFYADEMSGRNDLPTSAWIAAFEKIGRLGVMDLTLTGGEVFTRSDFFELLDNVIENRMRYSLLTNGTLLSEAILAKFDENKRRIRLNSIQVSIDGSQEEVHDRSRPRSFKRAIAGLRLLKDAGFPVTVRVTINKYNLHDLENIAYLLLEDIGLSAFSTNEASLIGAGCTNQDQVALNVSEQIQAMKILSDLLERYPGRITANAGPLAKVRMYAQMEEARRTGVKNSYTTGYLTSCGSLFSRLAILHDGAIVPCTMLHTLILGNIVTDSLEEIWLSHPTLQALRERRNIPLRCTPGCEDCEWANYCTGNCPGIAVELTGDFNRASPQDCYRRFLQEAGDTYVVNRKSS